MDLSPRLERLESEGADARRDHSAWAPAALFASYVSNAAIELTGGAIGLAFVALPWLGRWLWPALAAAADKPRRPHPVIGVFWGALAGFMSLLIKVGAPPFQIHILPQRLDKLTFVGTTVIFFAFMNWMKIVPYFAARPILDCAISRPRWRLLPLAVAANLLGIWLVRKTPTERFYRIAYLLMFLISLALIWQGGSGLCGIDRTSQAFR